MLDWGKWLGRLRKHKLRTPPLGPTPTNDLSTTVGNGLNVALRLLKEAVTGIGVPGLEAAVNGVVGVIDLIKDVRDNSIDLHDLNDRISSLANTISMAPNLHPGTDQIPESLLSRVNAFLSELHGMLNEVQRMLLDKNPAIRAANSQTHKDAITDISTRIARLLDQFTAQGVLSIELEVASARRDIRVVGETQKALVVAQEHIIVTQENLAVTQGGLVATQNAQVYESLINAIPRVHARYEDTSTKPTRPCHPGTRTGLLQIIRTWIDDDPEATPYFWLCGEVGVGKSTVAHTIAQEQEALHRLGASFFFSRHDDSRRTPHLLFTSIAYQLARFDEGFYKALAEALRPDPDIVKRSPMEQFKRLVLAPLAQSGIDPSRTVVIVIDGLDECLDPTIILDVLAQGIDRVGVHLRVLISSRPYADILSKFKGRRLCHLTNETQFRNIDPQTLSDDIASYLSWSLAATALESDLPSPWPPQEQLEELIRRAAGLFIIASTYAKYIENPVVGNPVDQLARILARRTRIGSSPLAELDDLYDQVLDDLKSRLSSDVETARDILGIIIHGQGNITVLILAGLLSVDPSDVRLVLRHLTAVIPLPERDRDAIVPFHASFGEYIQDPTRCTVRVLLVDAEATFGRIAVQCSNAFASTVKDGFVGVEYDSSRGYQWMPMHLIHATYHLPYYLSRSPPAQVEETRSIIIGTGIWPVFHIVSAQWRLSQSVELIDAAGGFEVFSLTEGSSEDGKSTSFGVLMFAHLISGINRISEMATKVCQLQEAEAFRTGQKRALKFVDFNPDIDGVIFENLPLAILRNVRSWMKYSHRNVMSFKSIDVKFDGKNAPQEILVFMESPTSIRYSSNLLGYLENNINLDVASRFQIALGVVDGLRYLHGRTPPQPHNGINPHQVMVFEGEPILHPSRWYIEAQSRLSPNVNDGVEEITCQFRYRLSLPGWYHWNPTGGDEWEHSLDARLQVDIWDFGSILYQIITGEAPLTTYGRLAEGNKTLGYDADLKSVPYDYWQDEGYYKARYEATVCLLLSTLQASEDVKSLLKSCWTIAPEDRPPINNVFERLKAIVDNMQTDILKV